jgi:ABC-type antimicrobial peptide transport system permease subunit
MRGRVTIAFLIAAALAGAALTAQPVNPDSPPAAVLVSRQLAARAQVRVGEVVTLAIDPAGRTSRTFRVAGIYEPTPDPMHFTAQRLEARVHLPDLLDLIADPADTESRDSVNTINLRLESPTDVAAVTSNLAARMPGLEVRPTSRPADNDPFAVLDRFHLAISLVTVTGSTAFLLALMIIRADERRETIGAMRLLGISRRSLLLEVALEGLVIASVGAMFGILVALAAEGFVNRVFQARYDTALVFLRVTPSIAVRSIAIAVPLGIAAGIVASWTLLRRNILSLVGR